MKVTTFITALVLMVTASQSFGFIPKRNNEAMITKDHIYLTDIKQELWRTQTDCNYSITKDSSVSIAILGNSYNNSYRPKTITPKRTKLLVTVDGERHVCRVLEVSQAGT